jgi:hypothetical protein
MRCKRMGSACWIPMKPHQHLCGSMPLPWHFQLLDNAVKYSGTRRQISIKVRRSDGCVELSITDKGAGSQIGALKILKFYRGTARRSNTRKRNRSFLTKNRRNARRSPCRQRAGKGSRFL